MDNLFEGVINFGNSGYKKYSELFKKIGVKQNPHTLFIGCSDSRVVPTLITGSLPGELFVVRNIANIVPFYRSVNEFLATTSAIEFAVNILDVKNIVVCGHSNCGGCKALYMTDEDLKNIPHTKKWLELAKDVKKTVLNLAAGNNNFNLNEKERELLTERENVKEQIKHLYSYPYIKNRLIDKKINIYGWHYIIETGEVYNYSFDKNCYEKINEAVLECNLIF
ncbi:MAG: carbonic anhydrase [Deltaproteobacteria bacterium]|nr:carbonic anhydrase [Deltaproteobacteria bacterium]